ncbi:MAG: hypothetical protein Q7U97_12035 [Rhodocyclaceae bacterium]|nr:hypothetical protein [Rhodocyclaceae bacterium]
MSEVESSVGVVAGNQALIEIERGTFICRGIQERLVTLSGVEIVTKAVYGCYVSEGGKLHPYGWVALSNKLSLELGRSYRVEVQVHPGFRIVAAMLITADQQACRQVVAG